MKYHGKLTGASADPDMTPMIDVTFQLVIFFLLTLNFSISEQSEAIKLPLSQLAKPADAPLESPISLQMLETGEVLMAGQKMDVSALRPLLAREKTVLQDTGRNMANATIIIRADRDVQTGKVQQVIGICQELGFVKFVLRAKQDLSVKLAQAGG